MALALWHTFPDKLLLLAYAPFGLALIALTAIDLEHRLLPDAITLPGTILGLLLSLAVGRALQGVLYGIGAFEPWPLLATAGLLMAVVLAASVLPARRAAAVDPIAALRAE